LADRKIVHVLSKDGSVRSPHPLPSFQAPLAFIGVHAQIAFAPLFFFASSPPCPRSFNRRGFLEGKFSSCHPANCQPRTTRIGSWPFLFPLSSPGHECHFFPPLFVDEIPLFYFYWRGFNLPARDPSSLPQRPVLNGTVFPYPGRARTLSLVEIAFTTGRSSTSLHHRARGRLPSSTAGRDKFFVFYIHGAGGLRSPS